MADTPDDFFGMPPLDLGETLGPQAPPQSAPSARSRAKDYAPLLALLPIVAQRGGRVGIAALLQGFQQARAQSQQDQRQQQQDAERQRQTSEAERLRRDTLAQTKANNEAQRREGFMRTFQTGLQSDALESPEAVRAFMEFYRPQAQALGIRPDALDAVTMEAMTPTRLQKKEANKVITDAKKQYGDQAVNNTYTLKDGTQANWEELNRRAGVGLGAPAPPKADVPNTPEEQFYQQFAVENGAKTFGELPTAKQAQARKQWMQADDRPPAPTGGEKPLTQNQRANIISSRRTQWQRFSKAVTDREVSIAKIDGGVAALDRGNRNAATQAIITGFNKLLDETSVVREGEYARSEQLVPLVSRIEGALQRLIVGGASMTDADLRALAREAKAIAASVKQVSSEAASGLRRGIEEELDDYAIPHSRVFGGSTIGVAKPPKAPRPATGNPFRGGDAGSSR